MHKNGRHYVIGDVHGCYDELMLLLHKIEEADSDAQIIFTGDFIDRGSKVWDVLTWMMAHITEDGKYQSVRGNHEEMVLEWYKEFKIWWKRCDGKVDEYFETIPETNYDFFDWSYNTGNLSLEKLEPIMQFFQSLPLEKKVTIQGKEAVPFRIVHAWTDFDKEESEFYKKDFCLWYRNYDGNQETKDIVVHGHTPTITRGNWIGGPGLVGFQKNQINVDGGCCFKERYYEYPCMLCAVCLETLETIYPMTLEERFLEIRPQPTIINELEDAKEYAEQYEKKYCRDRNIYKEEMKQRLENEEE